MSDPARFICIGTHHKTGTIWMRKVWHVIAVEQGIPLMQCYRWQKLAQAAETGPQIIVNWASTFPPMLMDMDHARFLHIVRDPRDVLVSGMRYHRKAPVANEKFLRTPREEWGGLTYKGYLNALPDDTARLIFEMENKHADTLSEMLKWPWGHPRARELRYEDLIEDEDCSLFRSVLEEFAIEGLDIDHAVKTYWDNSLFGGLATPENRSWRQQRHVTASRVTDWRTQLPREVAEIYADRHGAALVTLGYEDHPTAWVDLCPEGEELSRATG